VTLFLQFRLWLRRAPRSERALAAAATALVLSLAGWLLVPPSSNNADANAALGTQPGQPLSATPGATAPASPGASLPPGATCAPGPGSQTVTSSGNSGAGGVPAPGASAGGGTQSGTDGSGGCTSPPGSDQGVSDTQIKVAVILINLVGQAGNSAFGLPPPDTQRKWFQDVIDATNASGGVACRKIAPLFYQGNPADASNLQQLCLQITQAKPFMVIDLGAYTVNPDIATCYPKAGLPFRTTTPLPASQVEQYYPYMFSTTIAEMRYRNAVFGLKQRGFFSNGFKKLGVVYRDCVQQIPGQFFSWLKQAGVPSSAVVSYNFGCPSSGFASPSDIQAAILKFKQAGVTHMTEFEDTGDFPNFTNIAQQQGFTPKWGIPDDGVIATSYGSQHPNYQNIANAIAITDSRYGEEKTPGYVPSAGSKACNDIFKPAGDGTVHSQSAGLGGLMCNDIWLFKAAVEHARAMSRTELAGGLQAARSVEFSYPDGPNTFEPNQFTGSKVTYGDQFWRVDQFLPSCNCWHVVDSTFHGSFS
jgi:hypothetical protein